MQAQVTSFSHRLPGPGQVCLLGSQGPRTLPYSPRPQHWGSLCLAPVSVSESRLGSEFSACTFLSQARTEFLRKKARHQNSLPEPEAAEAGAPSSGPVDLFRELLEEGKGVTSGNKEYEEEKRQEKVSWPPT